MGNGGVVAELQAFQNGDSCGQFVDPSIKLHELWLACPHLNMVTSTADDDAFYALLMLPRAILTQPLLSIPLIIIPQAALSA